MSNAPKFQKTFCSSCGGEFGPGNSGYSHCVDHGSNRIRNRLCQMIAGLNEIAKAHPACTGSRNDADTPDELLDTAALLNEVAKLTELFAVGMMIEADVKGDFKGYITETVDENLTCELRVKAQDKADDAALNDSRSGRRSAFVNHLIKLAAE